MARAFDKAVRRKPLAFAADAGLWELHVGRERDAAEVGGAGVSRSESSDWAVVNKVVFG